MITRKEFCVAAVAGFAAVSGFHPEALFAEDLSKFENAVKEVTGSNASDIKDSDSVMLNVPEVAESGANVAVAVEIKMPVDQVKSVHIFVEKNPFPYIVGMTFSKLSGIAFVEARVRFAGSSAIRGIAILNDGTVIQSRKEVKVSVGGCG